MKKIFTVLFVSAPLFLIAQSLALTPRDTIFGEYTNTNQWASDYIYVKNISGEPMTINYELIENTFVPDWAVSICTNTGCYPIPPQTGTLGTIANNEEGFFNCHAVFWEFVGYGVMTYRVYDANDNNIADTLSFAYNVVEASSSTNDLGNEYSFQIGPNPTIGAITISNDQLQQFDVKVFSLNGQLVLNDKSQSSSWAGDISTLPPGNYFVMVTDSQRIIHKAIISKL